MLSKRAVRNQCIEVICNVINTEEDETLELKMFSETISVEKHMYTYE